MKIKTTVSFREYVKLIYGLLYGKAVMKLLLVVDVLVMAWIVLYYLHVGPLPKPLIYQYIMLFLITVVQPLIIYYTVWKNYHSSNHLRETLTIELTPKELKITGSSFYLEILWAKVFKVEEKTNWFLIYQNNLSAVLIDKKDLGEKELAELRALLGGIKRVPVALLG